MHVETFEHLRLPQWFRIVTGLVEVVGGLAILASIGLGWLAPIAALWLIGTMIGAVISHVRVQDSVQKMIPPVVLLVLALAVLVVDWSALSTKFA